MDAETWVLLSAGIPRTLAVVLQDGSWRVYLCEIWTTWKEDKTKDINIRDFKMKYSNQITLVWDSQTTGHAHIHTEELPTSFQTLIFNNKQTSKVYGTSEESYDLEEAEPM